MMVMTDNHQSQGSGIKKAGQTITILTSTADSMSTKIHTSLSRPKTHLLISPEIVVSWAKEDVLVAQTTHSLHLTPMLCSMLALDLLMRVETVICAGSSAVYQLNLGRMPK